MGSAGQLPDDRSATVRPAAATPERLAELRRRMAEIPARGTWATGRVEAARSPGSGEFASSAAGPAGDSAQTLELPPMAETPARVAGAVESADRSLDIAESDGPVEG